MARKILLADDSVTAQNMGRKILADAGYEVVAVNNGSAALKKIAEAKPDLIILDVYMPGYSGLEVCQRLKESPDTARIPVLLTVGKLEPFKPEEAQRVRAEGYIVKPFEASELLSALSKLEDKVVPRSEPSKPGRFARAMKAADDDDRHDPPRTENGWKSRITFPSRKDEGKAEEEVAVPSRSLEKFKESELPQSVPPSKTIDVAAFAPAGLPNSVTSAELAAIASAAAQIQMAGEALKREQETSSAESSPEFPVAPVLERFQDDDGGHTSEPPAGSTAAIGFSAAPASTELPVNESTLRRNGDQNPQEAEDVPATMAAHADQAPPSAANAPRWAAVSVALDGDEAAISLDSEMQKAQAVFATPDDSSAAPQVTGEAPVASIANPEPEAASKRELETKSVQSEVQPEAATEAVPASIESESATAEIRAEISQAQEFSPPEPASAPVAELANSGAHEAAEPARELQAVPESGSPAPEATGNAFPQATERVSDRETVKTAAAAWANWNQVHDPSQSGHEQISQGQANQGQNHDQPSNDTPGQPKPFDTPETQPQAAMAVAAGAEQIAREVSSSVPERNPEDVASIVDSVLAGLRPKLMEEISRKMSQKK